MTRGLALIADPSPLFCEGLRRLLRQERFSVCAEGRDVAEALTRLDGAVDLTLVICTLDTEACQQNIMQLAVLRTRFPATKIIVIADTTLSPSLWRQALGITDAILAQDISSKILQHSIDLVMLGQKFFAAPPPETLFAEVTAPLPSVTPLLASRWHVSESIVADIRSANRSAPSVAPTTSHADVDLTLSDRERQILNCLVRGYANKVIARELEIAEATVKVHIKGLLRRLRAANRTQAAVWALNNKSALNGIEVLAAE